MDNIKLDFDTIKCADRLSGVINKRQQRLDQHVLNDSNYFVYVKTGTMRDSGTINTVIGSGLVQWQTPYAPKLYYMLKTATYSKNPNATPKWFETAKTRHLKKWLAIANGET